VHYFKLPNLTTHVKRKWLHRTESNSSYDGRKTYTPQVGDSVVYIPRAHYETITKFPSLTAPWQSWPDGVEWPVVQCRVCYVRYRFPYKAYKSQVLSIVAILTLEITGIPEIDHERQFPWPKPVFIEPSKKHVFEVSILALCLLLFFLCCIDCCVQLHVSHVQSLDDDVDGDDIVVAGDEYNDDNTDDIGCFFF
jgi:hypothetical protein